MSMSLLDNLTHMELKAAATLTPDDCDLIAKFAKLKDLSYQGVIKPGEKLINDLNRRSYSAKQYRHYLSMAIQRGIKCYYRPKVKVAILIGNNNYVNLSNLATPSTDCMSLANGLRSLGFITITIKDVEAKMLGSILDQIFDVIPENCYCFIFYAGHGFELCNIKYILGVDSKSESIDYNDCLSENTILYYVSKCKPELCVLIMDMCRIFLDRELHPELYAQVPDVESYVIDGNMFIIYTTQSAMSAYEVVQIECSSTIENLSYVMKTGDSKIIVPGNSQYVTALCAHLTDDTHVSGMLDKVHEDLENAPKKQTPIKIQSGVRKRSLHDQTSGCDETGLLKKLKDRLNNDTFKQYCHF